MEKRVIGVILTLLGIIGLILAAVNFVNHSSASTYDIKAVSMYGILGLIFFFAGIGLVRSTKDVVKNNEKIS